MATKYRSEIRDNDVRDLLQKVKKQNYGMYLPRIRFAKIRAFRDESVDFEFPVTALIGTNGGGKSTILGAAAIAYKSIKPARFFPKSFIGDESMADWSMGYEIIDKTKNPTNPIQRSASFKRSRWIRDDITDRPVLYFGIQRTVPAGERTDFKKLASSNYKFSGQLSSLSETVQSQVAKILGKDVSQFQQAAISDSENFYVGGDGTISYSEFHFGAGESSVIRMVSEIEAAPENALVLIEEIENGLHPVATRRMVEYLMDVADRKSVQSIFTTHAEDALAPLPPEAIWSSIDGKARQGRMSIEALRAVTGRIDEKLAVFVEDDFAKEWVEAIIRNTMPEDIDQIGVYAVCGDSTAHSIHLAHGKNPAVAGKVRSICVLDGNSSIPEDRDNGVIKLPGAVPESEVFNYVLNRIDELSMKVAVAFHLSAEKDKHVKEVVKNVSTTNRDSHLLFNQVGQQAGLVAEKIVSSAFIALWMEGNRTTVDDIAKCMRAELR